MGAWQGFRRKDWNKRKTTNQGGKGWQGGEHGRVLEGRTGIQRRPRTGRQGVAGVGALKGFRRKDWNKGIRIEGGWGAGDDKERQAEVGGGLAGCVRGKQTGTR